MPAFLSRYADITYALLRFVAGGMFACHGAQKLFGAFGGQQVALQSMMGFAGVVELVGGLLVAVGFFAGWAAFLCSGQMAVAYFMVHAKQGLWPIVRTRASSPRCIASCSCTSRAAAPVRSAWTPPGGDALSGSSRSGPTPGAAARRLRGSRRRAGARAATRRRAGRLRGGARAAGPAGRAAGAQAGLPGHEELAIGAVATGGIRVLDASLLSQFGISSETLERIAERETRELERRERAYRGELPSREVKGKTVVLVDDGLATGSSMRAAVRALRQRGPAAVVVAVPWRRRAPAPRCARRPTRWCVPGRPSRSRPSASGTTTSARRAMRR